MGWVKGFEGLYGGLGALRTQWRRSQTSKPNRSKVMGVSESDPKLYPNPKDDTLQSHNIRRSNLIDGLEMVSLRKQSGLRILI